MEIQQQIGVVTGAASGIGQAIACELARREAQALALVDVSDAVSETVAAVQEASGGKTQGIPFTGDVTNTEFRKSVFDSMISDHGVPRICIPAAGITRDALAAKVDKETGELSLYSEEHFRLVLEVNLTAPTFWALEMIGRIAKDRFDNGKKRWSPGEGVQGTIVMIGSVSSQGNKGQVSYSATKSGLIGVASTLTKEGMFHGVRCGIIHPGFTDTPMVRAMGEEYVEKYILPATQLHRLIRPQEVADAACFVIANSAISGEVWVDAGWHPGP